MVRGRNKGVRIKWIRGAFRQIRTGDGVAADIDSRTGSVAAFAGAGGGTHHTDGAITGGRGRYRGAVFTGDYPARKASAQNDNLLRALDAGR